MISAHTIVLAGGAHAGLKFLNSEIRCTVEVIVGQVDPVVGRHLRRVQLQVDEHDRNVLEPGERLAVTSGGAAGRTIRASTVIGIVEM